MNRTTRAIAVLAGAIVLLAPVVTTVLEETLASADRAPFQETDWRMDPPDQDPPEDLPEGDEESPFEEEGPGPTPGCEIEREIVAFWHHPRHEEDPQAAMQNRTLGPTAQPFPVTEATRGLGIALEASNATGTLEASVHPEGRQDEAPFYEQRSNMMMEPVEATSTITPPELAPGTWEATLDHQASNHEELTFVVVAFNCVQEDPA